MTNTTYSPYKAASKINETLKLEGFDKKLPPQMFYTYTKKGYIASFKDEKGKVVIDEIELMKWYNSYKKKNLLGATNIDTNTTEEVVEDPNQMNLFEVETDTDNE